MKMTDRDLCPACGLAGCRTLVELAYDRPPLADYLRTFYREYPGCDFTPLAGQHYRLQECRNCGCVFQNPVPPESYLATFYGGGLYGRETGSPPPPNPYQVEQMIRELMMVVRFLAPDVGRPRVLDFGTGNGHWAVLAAATGVETHASDLSMHAFGWLQSRGIACHNHAELPAGFFDFINTEQVFEHLTDPAGQLRRLAECLRSGGIVKIGVPHDPALSAKLRNPDWSAPKNNPASLNGVAPIEHLNHFEPASLDALAARAGLEPLVIRGWSLISREQCLASDGLRHRTGRWLRARLGETYRPHHRLTQTAFYRKPGSA